MSRGGYPRPTHGLGCRAPTPVHQQLMHNWIAIRHRLLYDQHLAVGLCSLDLGLKHLVLPPGPGAPPPRQAVRES